MVAVVGPRERTGSAIAGAGSSGGVGQRNGRIVSPIVSFETPHRVVALFEAPVVLFDPIIFVAAAPVLHLLSQHFGDGPWIRVVSVGGHLFRTAFSHRLGTAEEASGRGPISFGTEPEVDELPVSVNGAIEITPASAHLEIRFIHIPANAERGSDRSHGSGRGGQECEERRENRAQSN